MYYLAVSLNLSNSLVIFTTAPTGLGHIRVMNALKDGLPDGVNSEEIGVTSVSASKIHALGSRINFLQEITEFYQTNDFAEKLVSSVYKSYQHAKSAKLVGQFKSLKEKYPKVKKWIIVATHFAFAHRIEFAKSEMEEMYGVDIYLFVVMTDDSPQRVWAVEHADMIFAPSDSTATEIKKLLGPDSKAKVYTTSFPVSPRLTQELKKEEFEKLRFQTEPDSSRHLHIEIPVSGAAVQLPYLQTIIHALRNEKYVFTVVGQETKYSKSFFQNIKKYAHVQALTGTSAKQTVKFYESLFYQPIRPAVEITKPSEQAFKAILKPTQRGGVILLLTAPIGRQEKDNLKFLKRHGLMPDEEVGEVLKSKLLNKRFTEKEMVRIKHLASHWRAIELPRNPTSAAKFIIELRKSGILSAMFSYTPDARNELTSNGVNQIWKRIDEYSKLQLGK